MSWVVLTCRFLAFIWTDGSWTLSWEFMCWCCTPSSSASPSWSNTTSSPSSTCPCVEKTRIIPVIRFPECTIGLLDTHHLRLDECLSFDRSWSLALWKLAFHCGRADGSDPPLFPDLWPPGRGRCLRQHFLFFIRCKMSFFLCCRWTLLCLKRNI